MSEQKREYSATEVGTILESVERKFDFLAELVAPMPERLEKIENRLGVLEIDVRSIKDVLRIEIPSMRSRIGVLEVKAKN